MKHLRVHMNSFKRVRAFQIELEFGSVGFWGEGKTGVPGEKPLGARERTNNKLNPHMASTPGFEPGPHWWEASALTTAPPLLPLMAWQWKQRIVRTDTIILEGAKRQLVMKNWINYSINTSINKSIDISIINWTVSSYVHETQVVFKLMYASFWPFFVCLFFFFAIGTCVCPQYFSVTVRPSPLDNGGSRGLTELIAGNIKKIMRLL